MKVLCIILALVTAGFSALTVMNFVSVSAPEELVLPDYSVAGDINYDSLASQLDAVKTEAQRNTQYPENMLDSMKNAYAVNNDLIGWVSIPGTEFDTSVTLGTDNNFYLKRDYYKVFTSSNDVNYGNLYLDYRSYTNTISNNMVIYGHTCDKPKPYYSHACRDLHSFKKPDYFKAHHIIRYSTLYDEYTYKICAVFLTNAEESADNGYVFNYIYPHMGKDNMVGYIEQVNQRMLYDTGVSLEPGDKIITLSTCTYDYGSINTRLVIVGRLLHEGESEDIDVSLVKARESYRMPDAWCKAKGIANPYANSARWEPAPDAQ